MPRAPNPSAPWPGAALRRAVLGALLASGYPAVARAHAEASPTSSNRYLKVALAGGGSVRIAWSLLIGEAPALAVRRAADANHDGLVDEPELAGYAATLARAVADKLTLELDGRPAAVTWEPPVAGQADRRVGPLPLTVDVVGTLRVAGRGPHTLRIDDATPIDELGESEIRIEEGPATRVLAGWQGREDGSTRTRFVWNGPRRSASEDRSVGVRFVDDRAPRPARRRLPLGVLGALVGAVVAAALLRRQRGRRPARPSRPT